MLVSAGVVREQYWNDAGTMLELCWYDASVCWNNVGIMLEICLNDSGTLARCWNDVGAMLETIIVQ